MNIAKKRKIDKEAKCKEAMRQRYTKKNDKKQKNTKTKSRTGVRLKIAASHTAHQTV